MVRMLFKINKWSSFIVYLPLSTKRIVTFHVCHIFSRRLWPGDPVNRLVVSLGNLVLKASVTVNILVGWYDQWRIIECVNRLNVSYTHIHPR